MTKEDDKTIKTPCNECGNVTKHLVLRSQVRTGQMKMDEYTGASVEWSTTWEMIECCGCESVMLKKTEWFSEWDGVKTSYFPPAASRKTPPWISDLPEDPQEVLQEVYSALNSDSRRLAMMGARCLVDLVALDKVGDKGSFTKALNALQCEGHLGAKQREYLEAALEVGHAVMHRAHKPELKNVNHTMDIVENLIQSAYLLDDAAKNLKGSTPPRNTR